MIVYGGSSLNHTKHVLGHGAPPAAEYQVP